MFCTKCGARCAEDSAFCHGCGARLLSGVAQQQEQEVIFSESFRANRSPTQPRQPYQPPEYRKPHTAYIPVPYTQVASYSEHGGLPARPKNKKAMGIILVMAGVAALITALLLMLLGGYRKPDNLEDAAIEFVEAALEGDREIVEAYLYEDLKRYAGELLEDNIAYERVEVSDKPTALTEYYAESCLEELGFDAEVEEAYQVWVTMYLEDRTKSGAFDIFKIEGEYYVFFSKVMSY